MPKRKGSVGGNIRGQDHKDDSTNTDSWEEELIPTPRPARRKPISIVMGPVTVGVNYGEIKVMGSRVVVDEEDCHVNSPHKNDCVEEDGHEDSCDEEDGHEDSCDEEDDEEDFDHHHHHHGHHHHDHHCDDDEDENDHNHDLGTF